MLRQTSPWPPATPAPGSDRFFRRVRRCNRISADCSVPSLLQHLVYGLRSSNLSIAVVGDIEHQGYGTHRFALLNNDAMEAQQRRCIAGISKADVAFQPETPRSGKLRADHTG